MPRFHIIHFMSLTVIAAIIVVILGRPAEGLVLIPTLFGLVIVSPIVLPLIPRTPWKPCCEGRPRTSIDTLLALERQPSPIDRSFASGRSYRLDTQLMQLYMRQQRFGDGIDAISQVSTLPNDSLG